MKQWFMSAFLILQFLKFGNLQGLVMVNDQNQRSIQAAVTFQGSSDTEVAEDKVNNIRSEGLSTESLAKLYDVAKNISLSKGIYMDSENEGSSDDKPDVRRSILRKVAVETESDVMKAILYTFNTAENKATALDQMEYMVHQYDVAVNFAQMGGIEILTPFLFSSDDHIASSAASVLGAAMQSNPTVQELAVKHNVGGNLLKLLSHKSPSVLSRVIFALASFLRNVPEAQDEFFAMNGISKLADILKMHQISTNIKLKIINLFSDLSVELAASQLSSVDAVPEKVSKRAWIFSQEIQICNICRLVPTFLNLEDFDTREKVAGAMTSLKSICLKDFQNEEVRNRIKQLKKLYNPDQEESVSVYAAIDLDLKRELYDDLKFLLNEINKEDTSEQGNGLGIRKTEL